MKPKNLFLTAGISYIVIFFSAIFANFVALEKLNTQTAELLNGNLTLLRWGIVAFLIAVIFDVVVAWALQQLYKKHPLTDLSTFFRLIHATIFAAAVFALVEVLSVSTVAEALSLSNTFNNLWLIGLFFFGIHLMLLPKIIKLPKLISVMLFAAGGLYMLDTVAHFVMPNYVQYADIFLAFVAVSSIFGEMAFSIWLFFQKDTKSINIK